MAIKKEAPYPFPDKLKLYEKLVDTIPEIERKGATVPYTSYNGHMFSYMAKDGALALRLPKGELEKFLKKYKTTLCEAYGIVQKEYAVVPDTLLSKTKELHPYLQISFDYVKTMKPKPNTKK